MSSSYLDDFLGSVSGLPADLQRTLSTIRELDEASQGLVVLLLLTESVSCYCHNERIPCYVCALHKPELQKTMAGGFEELADKSSKGAKKGGAAMVIADEVRVWGASLLVLALCDDLTRLSLAVHLLRSSKPVSWHLV